MASDWQRALVALTATVIGAVVIGLLSWARTIFIPVTLAIFLAFVLTPVVSRLQRRGLGRTLAVVATVGMVVLGSFAIGTVILQQITQLAGTLPDRREAIKEKITEAKKMVVGNGENRFGKLVDGVGEIISPTPAGGANVVVEQAPPSMASQWSGYLDPAVEMLGQAAFTFILTVFMLLNREDLRNRMIRLLGSGSVTTTTKAVDDASRRISKYLLSQLMVNTTFGLIITVAMFALGVNYSILWGFIATLMRYVPYIGTWIGLIPPVLFSFATAEGWGQPIAVFGVFIGLEMISNNLVEPKLYGQSMGLSEVAQLVAAAFWSFLWGPIGLILSGPLTVCLLVLGRHVSQFEFFVILLGDQPVLDPQVAFYQRLAARDQDEAAELAVAAARAKGPTEALDEMVIPALVLARRDHELGNLDKADLRYVVLAAREVAEEVAELRVTPTEPGDARVRVLVCPARDETEHVAAEILALTLDTARWEVKVAADETLASELVEQVADFRPAVVVVATMPPGGLSHARYLLARLRQRFPEVKLIVGRWGTELAEADNRTETIKNNDGIDRTLAATRKRLYEMHVALAAGGGKFQERGAKTEVVGTPGA